MRHRVSDASALPYGSYAQSVFDATVYCHGESGDVYVRDDGAPWEHKAYRVVSNGCAEPRSFMPGFGGGYDMPDSPPPAPKTTSTRERRVRGAE